MGVALFARYLRISLALTMTATFLYLEQVRLVAEHFSTPEVRTRLFSTLDFATNVLTWLTQILIMKTDWSAGLV